MNRLAFLLLCLLGGAHSMMSGLSSEAMKFVYPAEGLHAPPDLRKRVRRYIRRLGRNMGAMVKAHRAKKETVKPINMGCEYDEDMSWLPKVASGEVSQGPPPICCCQCGEKVHEVFLEWGQEKPHWTCANVCPKSDPIFNAECHTQHKFNYHIEIGKVSCELYEEMMKEKPKTPQKTLLKAAKLLVEANVSCEETLNATKLLVEASDEEATEATSNAEVEAAPAKSKLLWHCGLRKVEVVAKEKKKELNSLKMDFTDFTTVLEDNFGETLGEEGLDDAEIGELASLLDKPSEKQVLANEVIADEKANSICEKKVEKPLFRELAQYSFCSACVVEKGTKLVLKPVLKCHTKPARKLVHCLYEDGYKTNGRYSAQFKQLALKGKRAKDDSVIDVRHKRKHERWDEFRNRISKMKMRKNMHDIKKKKATDDGNNPKETNVPQATGDDSNPEETKVPEPVPKQETPTQPQAEEPEEPENTENPETPVPEVKRAKDDSVIGVPDEMHKIKKKFHDKISNMTKVKKNIHEIKEKAAKAKKIKEDAAFADMMEKLSRYDCGGRELKQIPVCLKPLLRDFSPDEKILLCENKRAQSKICRTFQLSRSSVPRDICGIALVEAACAKSGDWDQEYGGATCKNMCVNERKTREKVRENVSKEMRKHIQRKHIQRKREREAAAISKKS